MSLRRFLADMMALLSRPICPICGWLWCYVSPVVLLGLLMAVFIQLGMRPLTYMAWDSNTVSVHSLRSSCSFWSFQSPVG